MFNSTCQPSPLSSSILSEISWNSFCFKNSSNKFNSNLLTQYVVIPPKANNLFINQTKWKREYNMVIQYTLHRVCYVVLWWWLWLVWCNVFHVQKYHIAHSLTSLVATPMKPNPTLFFSPATLSPLSSRSLALLHGLLQRTERSRKESCKLQSKKRIFTHAHS